MHPSNPLLIAGGTQDNGNVVFQGTLGWSLYTGGDGGDTVWDPTPGTTLVYAEIEWFFFEGRNVFQFYRCQPGGCVQRRNGLDLNDAGPFIPRIIMDPASPATLWLAVERMWRTDNRADTWTAASPSVAMSRPASAVMVTTGSVAPWEPDPAYSESWQMVVRASAMRSPYAMSMPSLSSSARANSAFSTMAPS